MLKQKHNNRHFLWYTAQYSVKSSPFKIMSALPVHNSCKNLLAFHVTKIKERCVGQYLAKSLLKKMLLSSFITFIISWLKYSYFNQLIIIIMPAVRPETVFYLTESNHVQPNILKFWNITRFHNLYSMSSNIYKKADIF